MLLSTLIKTRLRANRFGMILSCAIMLGASILCALLHPLIFNEQAWDTLGLFNGIFVSIYMTCAFATFASIVAGAFLIFYSMFSIYGSQSSYLYFTLPLSRKNIFHASMITYAIESLILSVITIASLVIFIVPYIIMVANNMDPGFGPSIPTDDMLNYGTTNAFTAILSILEAITTFVLGIITSAAACIFGCSLAKKHKFIGTVVASLVISSVQGLVSSIVSAVPIGIIAALSSTMNSKDAESLAETVPLVCTLITSVILILLIYKFSLNQVEKKFDIE